MVKLVYVSHTDILLHDLRGERIIAHGSLCAFGEFGDRLHVRVEIVHRVGRHFLKRTSL